VAVLSHYQEQYPSVDLLNAAYDAQVANGDRAGALQVLKSTLAQQPSLLALDKFLGSHVDTLPAEINQDAQLMRDVVRGHTLQAGYYRCAGCGFDAKQYYWQCPGCLRWEIYSPLRTE
jgi:lipopolysaccharide biosynthesis regulator YciM